MEKLLQARAKLDQARAAHEDRWRLAGEHAVTVSRMTADVQRAADLMARFEVALTEHLAALEREGEELRQAERRLGELMAEARGEHDGR